ncbi:hypothetical protein OHB26_24815 [Nocardia sp. NBC_01503]|uniref:hypothetical protein n=1 Tax=Nocardia sp. NBC_01503 TaxID=2975997 RepID=UPI002E7AEC4A|nr:hypothetical protein [Nocardia sp. NBC_01503]WTL30159.1 hypothetical protein OHB26_24815 [Nocardia sp. NBC_01503]
MTTTTEPVEDVAQESSDTAAPLSHPTPTAAKEPRAVSIRLSTVLVAAGIAALLALSVTFGVLYASASSELSDRDATAADDRHAEQIATDYALGASTIDYHDVKAWLGRLQAGTTPQLSAKFEATAPQLEQILLPLQWTSKATSLSAAVTSESGGIYKVNAYLNVTSTSAQTPNGAQSTITYSMTIDRNSGWKITEVGGMQNALPIK